MIPTMIQMTINPTTAMIITDTKLTKQTKKRCRITLEKTTRMLIDIVARDFFHDIINGESLRYYKMFYSITPLSTSSGEPDYSKSQITLRQREVGFCLWNSPRDWKSKGKKREGNETLLANQSVLFCFAFLLSRRVLGKARDHSQIKKNNAPKQRKHYLTNPYLFKHYC